MELKILNSITARIYKERDYVIGTHNGVFHSDEVVAVAILCLYHSDKNIRIIRTRDMKILAQCNICVDVGGGEYDHHQPGFMLGRKDGMIYASAGLVWKSFGKELISKIMKRTFPEGITYAEEICNKFDENVISVVDAEDNGIKDKKHCFSFITSFTPQWYEDKPNFDEKFREALEVTVKILKEQINKTIGDVIAEKVIKQCWKTTKYFSDNILEILTQTIPWVKAVTEINESAPKEQSICFVIFPYPTGGWAAQCVPPSMEKKFDKKIPFPREWAGHTAKLPEISGVKDATFCHNGCFFVRAKTKEGVIGLCKKAMKQATK